MSSSRVCGKTTLSDLKKGQTAVIRGLDLSHKNNAKIAESLEKRLLEMGFVEGVALEVLHFGPLGGDPIAVRVGASRVALRREEARAVIVDGATPHAGRKD